MSDDDDQATDDDRRRRIAIMDADPRDLSRLLHAFYADTARANRTPRAVLYLHLGLLAGALDRVARELDRRDIGG